MTRGKIKIPLQCKSCMQGDQILDVDLALGYKRAWTTFK